MAYYDGLYALFFGAILISKVKFMVIGWVLSMTAKWGRKILLVAASVAMTCSKTFLLLMNNNEISDCFRETLFIDLPVGGKKKPSSRA